MHTPSLNHATAAAILRNGYLTHASPVEQDKLAVNLSSARVRRAKYLIDGVRNGQSLETLLGYLFERGLHDWTTRPTAPVILDQLKPLFRKAFPIKRTKVPQQGIAGWLATALVLHSAVNQRSSHSVIFYWSLTALWSPFITIGLFPFMLLALWATRGR